MIQRSSALKQEQSSSETPRPGIATIYSGVLALTFAAAETANQAPARAIVPALFLGIALVAGAAYVPFLTRGKSVYPPTPHSTCACV